MMNTLVLSVECRCISLAYWVRVFSLSTLQAHSSHQQVSSWLPRDLRSSRHQWETTTWTVFPYFIIQLSVLTYADIQTVFFFIHNGYFSYWVKVFTTFLYSWTHFVHFNSVKKFEDLLAPYRAHTLQKNEEGVGQRTHDCPWIVSDEEIEKNTAKVNFQVDENR